jgi:uncharacterized membrane protein YphA (DoxX/SURF4 family)
LQRSFSTFPGGRPGIGLLLLRVSLGSTAIVQATLCFFGQGPDSWGAKIVGALSVAIGASLLLGIFTPIGSGLIVLGSVGIALSWLPSTCLGSFHFNLSTFYIIVMAAAIIFLGPGAFSLDSRLFGRREIQIPPRHSIRR